MREVIGYKLYMYLQQLKVMYHICIHMHVYPYIVKQAETKTNKNDIKNVNVPERWTLRFVLNFQQNLIAFIRYLTKNQFLMHTINFGMLVTFPAYTKFTSVGYIHSCTT